MAPHKNKKMAEEKQVPDGAKIISYLEAVGRKIAADFQSVRWYSWEVRTKFDPNTGTTYQEQILIINKKMDEELHDDSADLETQKSPSL